MKLCLLLFAAVIAITQCVWVDEMENNGMFEGDMDLDPDEREGVLKTNSFASIKGGRWPGGVIPYYIEGSIGSRGRSAIAAAIADYQKYTCLRFKKRSNEGAYISFYRGGGCSSPVGYRRGRRNRVSLAGGCQSKGITMHEIGHSIGLYHEQSRPDRDNYVKILWNNIQSSKQFNFKKHTLRTIDSLGTPYDFRSMMHYSSNAFGGRRRTIQTIDPKNQGLIGKRGGFSEIDIKQINLMYKCSGTGATLPPPECKDNHSRCKEWADRNPSECKKNPRYMLNMCKLSCKVC